MGDTYFDPKNWRVSKSKNDPDISVIAEQLADIAKKTDGIVSVTKFGADPTGVNDSTTALQQARDYIASLAQPPALVFPAGIYKYSVSPNWAIQDAVIINLGEVRLRYTGTGNAVILDGGTTGAGIHNLTFGQFIIESPATAGHGMFSRAVHHSKIGIKVLGCGSTSAGLATQWNVCTEFRVIVSGNEEGWYQNAKPKYGVFLTGRNAGEDTSYCTFINPILENVDIGSYLDVALGNSFIGGTMEACSTFGTQLTTNAYNNKYFNVDFEVNANADIYCQGRENHFIGCDGYETSVLEATSKNNMISGGAYTSWLIVTGAEGNLMTGVKYNRFNNGGAITDNGTKTRFRDNYNMGLKRHENNPPSRTQLTLTGSPFTYTNASGNEETMLILGGTVSQLTYVHNGIGDVVTGLNSFRLFPNDQVTITYSVAPVVIKYAG